MTIIEKTTDMAGKTRILARLPNGKHVFLKFSHDPSDQELDLEQERATRAISAIAGKRKKPVLPGMVQQNNP